MRWDSLSGIGLKGDVAYLWAVLVTSERLILDPGSSTLMTRADLALSAPDGGLKYTNNISETSIVIYRYLEMIAVTMCCSLPQTIYSAKSAT